MTKKESFGAKNKLVGKPSSQKFESWKSENMKITSIKTGNFLLINIWLIILKNITNIFDRIMKLTWNKIWQK